MGTNMDFLELFTEDFRNKQNIAAYDKYFTSDFVYHHAEGDMNGEQYKGLCQAYFTAFPDLHITTDRKIAELGDSMDNLGMMQQLGVIQPLGG